MSEVVYTSLVLYGLPFCIVNNANTLSKPVPGKHVNRAQRPAATTHHKHRILGHHHSTGTRGLRLL